MPLTTVEWGQLFTLSMIALAMGTDAFSFGVGMGTKRPAVGTISKLSASVGFFHVLMPLIGMAIGQLLGKVMKDVAVMVGGGMLCFLGLSMLWHVIREGEEDERFRISSWGSILLFSLSVSLDSLSAGLSLGLFDADIWLALLLFGLFSFAMTGIGLVLGRFMGGWIGTYGEVIGGMILIYLGCKFMI
ncbi:putative Mn2+ efflux pump MntP [Laceyella sediminis]|uniref:Putative manganese efflux pump MntP n=1 Tax=Laceyella sediminis TaxID=573074 RepID=A0ABX5ETL8_9BACL|nr:manganese efflux pump [Laceyella sediminis]PRZ16522.1 putative Mn2+ efflux pump MntP [Laceyella sediminis]